MAKKEKTFWERYSKKVDKAWKKVDESGDELSEKAYRTGEKISEALLKKWAATDKLGKRHKIPIKTRLAIYKRDGNKCVACHRVGKQKCPHCHRPVGRLNLDHRIPLKEIKRQPFNPLIGLQVHDPKNYQTLCSHHNHIKSDRFPCYLARLRKDEC